MPAGRPRRRRPPTLAPLWLAVLVAMLAMLALAIYLNHAPPP